MVAMVGDGTRQLGRLNVGDVLNCVLPLGNSFTLPSDFSGNITVEFNPPWYWQVSQIISFMSVIYMIIELKKNSFKNHSPKP